MISNALAATGPDADWWGYLKSIDHALSRVLDTTGDIVLCELDTDRLQALCDLLDDVLYFSASANPEKKASPESSFLSHLKAPDFSPSVNLRRFITENEAFQAWAEPQKQSPITNIKRLADSLKQTVDSAQKKPVPQNPQKRTGCSSFGHRRHARRI